MRPFKSVEEAYLWLNDKLDCSVFIEQFGECSWINQKLGAIAGYAGLRFIEKCSPESYTS